MTVNYYYKVTHLCVCCICNVCERGADEMANCELAERVGYRGELGGGSGSGRLLTNAVATVISMEMRRLAISLGHLCDSSHCP